MSRHPILREWISLCLTISVEKVGCISGVETYLTEAREGKLSVPMLEDIIDLQGQIHQINIEVTLRMRYRRERSEYKQEISVSCPRPRKDKKS